MADVPSTDGLSKEALFPERFPQKFEEIEEKPDGVDLEAQDTGDAPDDDETDEALADAQEGESESEEASTDESGKMSIKDFAKQAGWSLEEIYRDIVVPLNGKDVSLHEALETAKDLHVANDALSQERDALQEKLSSTATAAPGQMTPELIEAYVRSAQAQEYQNLLLNQDWSQLDPQQANSQRLDLQQAIQVHQQHAQAKHAEHMNKVQQQLGKAREECDRQLRSKIPTWADARVRSNGRQSAKDVAREYGYSSDEFEAWTDPRAIHMAHELATLKAERARIKKGAKRVRKVGRTMAPGSRGATQDKASPADSARRIREAKSPDEARALRMKLDLGDLR